MCKFVNEEIMGKTIKSSCHEQLSGQAFYSRENKISEEVIENTTLFMFCPDSPAPDQVLKFRATGVAQQMSDGTFDFIAKKRYRAKSQLIKKLAHGRASVTRDGAIQLTLKVWADENIEIAEAIYQEAAQAADAIRDYQLRGH